MFTVIVLVIIVREGTVVRWRFCASLESVLCVCAVSALCVCVHRLGVRCVNQWKVPHSKLSRVVDVVDERSVIFDVSHPGSNDRVFHGAQAKMRGSSFYANNEETLGPAIAAEA